MVGFDGSDGKYYVVVDVVLIVWVFFYRVFRREN